MIIFLWALLLFSPLARADLQSAAPHRQKGEAVYRLSIDYKDFAVKGIEKRAMAINGSIPAPTLRFKEGERAVIYVTNKMDVESSIHWHGILLPNFEDGVAYLTSPPIRPGKTHRFEFPINQYPGTYWYHSHTGLQEQDGLYGAFIIEPKRPTIKYNKELVLVLSDWTNENPNEIMRSLKRGSEWHSIQKKTVISFFDVLRRGALGAQMKMWLKRMPGMDISDVYYSAFLINGKTQPIYPQFKAGDRVRLRVINASASTYFWLTFGGGPALLVSADGVNVQPILKNKILHAVAETYDFILEIPANKALEFKASAEDGSGAVSAVMGQGELLKALDLPKPDLIEGMKAMAKSHSAHSAHGASAHSRASKPHALHGSSHSSKGPVSSDQESSSGFEGSASHPHSSQPHASHSASAHSRASKPHALHGSSHSSSKPHALHGSSHSSSQPHALHGSSHSSSKPHALHGSSHSSSKPHALHGSSHSSKGPVSSDQESSSGFEGSASHPHSSQPHASHSASAHSRASKPHTLHGSSHSSKGPVSSDQESSSGFEGSASHPHSSQPHASHSASAHSRASKPHALHGSSHSSSASHYNYLKALKKTSFSKNKPVREINLNLTGNMWRYVWSFNGKVLSEESTIKIQRGEIARVILNNKTMMRHPMHLHGHFFRVLNENGEYSPLKHTVDVPPMEKVVIEFLADEKGDWIFHCHILYHMKGGMSRIFSYGDKRDERLKDYPLSRFLKGDTHWFKWAEIALMSHRLDLSATAVNTRNELFFEGAASWFDDKYNQRKDFEVEAGYERFLSDFFRLYGGLEFKNKEPGDIKDTELSAHLGLKYLLPYFFDLDLSVSHLGLARLRLDYELMIFSRWELFAEWESSLSLLKPSWSLSEHEWELGLEYILSRDFSLVGSYDSHFGWGAGFGLRL